MNKGGHLHLLSIVGITILLLIFYRVHQPFLKFEEQPLADAYHYALVYQNVSPGADPMPVRSPFNARILTPWLASLLPFDIDDNFFAVNAIFAILSMALFVYIFREFGFNYSIIWLVCLWLLFHFTGPVRHTAFNPLNVDMGLYFFEALLLIIVLKKKFRYLWIIAVLGVMQKEVMLAYIILLFILGFIDTFFLKGNYFNLKWMFIAVLVALGTQYVVGKFFPSSTPGRYAFKVLYFHLRETCLHPVRFSRWLGATVASYGMILFIPLIKRNINLTQIDHKKIVVILFGLISIFFGLAGGDDHTRIMLLAFPFLIPAVHLFTRNDPRPWVYNLIISIPIFKVWKNLGEPADHWFELYSWSPDHQPVDISLWWIGYGFLIAVIFIWIRRSYGLNSPAKSRSVSDS